MYKKNLIIASLCIFNTTVISSQNLVDEIFNGVMKEFLVVHNNDSIEVSNYTIENKRSVVYGLELFYLKIPLDKASMRIIITDSMDITSKIYSNSTTQNSLVLVSGGFWGYNHLDNEIPLGLIISNGSIKNGKINWKTGGVLFQKNDKIQIQHISQFNEFNIQEGIQSKPLLVRAGKNDIYSDDKNYFDRIAIGITHSNEIIISGIFNSQGRGVSLYEFAEILVENECSYYPNTKIAIAMDGGPSSYLYFPSLQKHIGHSKKNYIPNLIEFAYDK